MLSDAPGTAAMRAVPSRPPQLRPASIAGLGTAVPSTVVGNDEVAGRLGVSDRWIVTRTGVRERRIAAPDDRLDDLAAAAGRAALESAGIDAAQLDLVVVATMAADELTPNAAPLVASLLGAHHAGAFDVGAACTGFLSGLSLAAAHVEAGRAEYALVIGVDLLSRLTDHSDRGTAALFADGAGAVVVAPGEDHGGWIGPVILHFDGEGALSIQAHWDDRKIRMQGQDVFREAVRRMSEVTLEAAGRSSLALEEIDHFVYHQANARILAAVGDRLGLDPSRVVDCIDRFGNTSSATIPIALADAEAEGLIEPGSIVLLAAFGAGFTWGGATVQWA
jgi:3-oxoacyl-[acyl-carrier-protein] synthase-3